MVKNQMLSRTNKHKKFTNQIIHAHYTYFSDALILTNDHVKLLICYGSYTILYGEK